MNILLWSFIFLHLLINIFTAGCTGKSFSEELILASTNPQYNIRLLVEFIELQAQYMKTTSLELVVYMNYSECKYKNKKQFLYTTDQFCEQCAKNQYYIFKVCISTE
jgi:hypothetical protein